MASNRLSVVVPTYEESENVRPLCHRLFAATKQAGLEVALLLVDDDSGTGTEETVKAVEEMRAAGYAVDIHVRKRHEGRGLSSAVLVGLQKAEYDVMLVMDADLQHEPESVPAVAQPVLSGAADFAVGSRNVNGGAVAEGWPLVRRIISNGATLLARPLTPCKDPMSGFFCLSREALKRAEAVRSSGALPARCVAAETRRMACPQAHINPMGYKIGLELMVRSRCTKVQEVPITFRDRCAGNLPGPLCRAQ